MQITYDPDADVLYIRCTDVDSKDGSNSRFVNENHREDLYLERHRETNALIGFEILDASQMFPMEQLLGFDRPTP